jgi:voltage-gated potassium channel
MHGLFLAVALILAGGTVFYSTVEDWRVLDAFYFSVTTLTTVGFGDFAPRTDEGKLFTVAYLVLGIGVIATFVTTVVQRAPVWQKARKDLGAPDIKSGKFPGS